MCHFHLYDEMSKDIESVYSICFSPADSLGANAPLHASDEPPHGKTFIYFNVLKLRCVLLA